MATRAASLSKGNVFPFADIRYPRGMNRILDDHQIRATFRELRAARSHVSGRALSAELKKRFGAVGKRGRVFAIWRDEVGKLSPPLATMTTDVADLLRRVEIAETLAAENLARAERAELREQAHQDAWAMEIDRLRQELKRFGPMRPPISTVTQDLIVGPTGRVHQHQLLGGRGQFVVEFSDLETRGAIHDALVAVFKP